MRKKYILVVIFLLFSSCSTITPRQYIENGEYVEAIQEIVNEIDDIGIKKLDIKTKNRMEKEIKDIKAGLYENLLNEKNDRTIIQSYFNIWLFDKTFQENPNLQKILNYESKSLETMYKLKQLIVPYVSEATSDRVKFLTEILVEIEKKKDILNEEETRIYRDLAKSAADIYVEMAQDYELNRNYEKAMYGYNRANIIYSPFQQNYRNSHTKYLQSKKIVEINQALAFYEKGKNSYKTKNYSDARYNLENAKKLFEKYGENQDIVNDIVMMLNNLRVYEVQVNYISYYNEAVKKFSQLKYASTRYEAINYKNEAQNYLNEAAKYARNDYEINKINDLLRDINDYIYYYF